MCTIYMCTKLYHMHCCASLRFTIPIEIPNKLLQLHPLLIAMLFSTRKKTTLNTGTFVRYTLDLTPQIEVFLLFRYFLVVTLTGFGVDPRCLKGIDPNVSPTFGLSCSSTAAHKRATCVTRVPMLA